MKFKFGVLKKEVEDVVRKYYKRAKLSYGFIVGGVDLVACDKDGNLTDKGCMSYAGNEYQSLDNFTKKDIEIMIADMITLAFSEPRIDIESLEVAFAGRYDGWASVHTYKSDEMPDTYIEDFYIPIWTLKNGFKVIDTFE